MYGKPRFTRHLRGVSYMGDEKTNKHNQRIQKILVAEENKTKEKSIVRKDNTETMKQETIKT